MKFVSVPPTSVIFVMQNPSISLFKTLQIAEGMG